MKNRTYCGPAIIQYIINNESINNTLSIKKNEVWCCNLAAELIKLNFSVKVRCYHSNLFNDAVNSEIDYEGFKSVRDLNKLKIIEEFPISEKILIEEISNYKYCVYNVKSGVFNRNTMNGGHYILAYGLKNNSIVKIVNPIINDYQIRTITTKRLVKCLKDFGSWRILINNNSTNKDKI